MRRLLTLIVLAGAFLGGYYLRGLDGSPDIFGWFQENYPRFSQAGQALADEISDPDGTDLRAQLADRFARSDARREPADPLPADYVR